MVVVLEAARCELRTPVARLSGVESGSVTTECLTNRIEQAIVAKTVCASKASPEYIRIGNLFL
jgi:hypothetical protein